MGAGGWVKVGRGLGVGAADLPGVAWRVAWRVVARRVCRVSSDLARVRVGWRLGASSWRGPARSWRGLGLRPPGVSIERVRWRVRLNVSSRQES